MGNGSETHLQLIAANEKNAIHAHADHTIDPKGTVYCGQHSYCSTVTVDLHVHSKEYCMINIQHTSIPYGRVS